MLGCWASVDVVAAIGRGSAGQATSSHLACADVMEEIPCMEQCVVVAAALTIFSERVVWYGMGERERDSTLQT